jgi:heptosyltransferase-3
MERIMVKTPPTQLVAPELLARADRILFVTHLAIGDFTYMQACLRAFAAAYPHIAIHVWVDERRRTADAAAWAHLRNYALFDWLAACPWIARVYDRTYSPDRYAESVYEARCAAYPLVVSLAVLDCHRYARLARTISPHGYVVGLRKPAERWVHALSRYTAYRKFDAALPVYTAADSQGLHISDIYAGWFERCFGLALAPAARRPVLDIPPAWTARVQAQFLAWGLAATTAPVIFVNAYSKSPDRSWPLERVVALMEALRGRPAWRDARFVVNALPEVVQDVRKLVDAQPAPLRACIRLFSAEENFFQLPATLALCSLVISVETAVMHLANAVGVPVLALMRCNHPEWAPLDKANSTVIMAAAPEDWVTSIHAEDVLAVLDAAPARLEAARVFIDTRARTRPPMGARGGAHAAGNVLAVQ